MIDLLVLMMADDPSSSFAATKKLNDQLTCPVCLEQFTDPRTLPCLHSFCTGCLEKLHQEDGSRSISCPTCRTPTDLPQQGIAAFPKAFYLNNFIEVQNLLKKASGKQKVVCDNCGPSEEAAVYCQECDKFICSFCNDAHKRWTSFSMHKVMSISEVSSKATQMVSTKPTPVMNCPTHDKQLDLYCVTCEQPICYHCTIKSHKGHTHDLVSDAYAESKKEIQERIGSLEQEMEEETKKNARLEKSKKEMQKKGEKLRSNVNELCDSFVRKIEKVRSLGLQSIDSGVMAFLKCEEQRMKEVESKIEALQSCKEHAEHSLQMSTPAQLLATKKQVMARIEKLLGTKNEMLHRLSIQQTRTEGLVEIELIDDEEKLKKSLHYVLQNHYDDITYNPSYGKLSGDLSSHVVSISGVNTPNLEGKVSSSPQNLEDQAVDGLRTEVLSIAPLQFPEEVYKQCEFMPDFPIKVDAKTTSTAKFSLSFQGHQVLVSKNYITCFFTKKPSRVGSLSIYEIPCKVDYFIQEDAVKYQVSFTTTANDEGEYSFTLKIGQVTVDTKSTSIVIPPHSKYRKAPPLPLAAEPFPPPHYEIPEEPRKKFKAYKKKSIQLS